AGPPMIALDGRGAEPGADVLVAGAIAAARDGISLRVFGDREALAGLDGEPRVELVDAREEITNDDEPVKTVRARQGASAVLPAAAGPAGRADATVSAGPTGATMAAATFALRRIHGVRRPALAVQLLVPGRDGPPTLLLDVGANSEVRPGDLVQFAFIGSAFSRAGLGVERPRAAPLSVREGAGQGSPAGVRGHPH